MVSHHNKGAIHWGGGGRGERGDVESVMIKKGKMEKTEEEREGKNEIKRANQMPNGTDRQKGAQRGVDG
jgi:hypothetical protein